MSRGNDAIPSWSGFNYQGKMMLLCTLEKLNSLNVNDDDLDSYEVELEKKEDYAFIEAGIYTAFYQVKASISKNKWTQYEDALKKLLDHRNSSGNPSAKCYFVIAREFVDWTDSSNTYQSLIDLYRYDSKVVDVKDVKDNTIREIQKLLSNKCLTALNLEAVYGALCIFLDEKIAFMHKQKFANRKYTISFLEILNVIVNAVNKQKEDAEYVLKERVYEHMYQTVDAAICEICNNKCSSSFGACMKECAAKYAVELILQLSNIGDYCKLINPDKHGIWDDYLQYAEHFSKDAVEKYILTVFAKSENQALVKEIDNAVGMKSAYNPLDKGIVIPTMLKFEDPFKNIEDSMQCKLQKIKDNSNNIRNLFGNSIIVDSSDVLHNTTLSQAQITSAWDKVNDESIRAVEDDIGFVSYKELLTKFISEGGNHE